MRALVVVALGLATAAWGQKSYTGPASGVLRVQGEERTLVRSYAVEAPGGGSVLLIVADRELPYGALRDDDARGAWVREHDAAVLEVRIESGGPSVTGCRVRRESGGGSPAAGERCRSTTLDIDQGWLAAEVASSEDAAGGRGGISFHAAVRAPLVRSRPEAAAVRPQKLDRLVLKYGVWTVTE